MEYISKKVAAYGQFVLVIVIVTNSKRTGLRINCTSIYNSRSKIVIALKTYFYCMSNKDLVYFYTGSRCIIMHYTSWTHSNLSIHLYHSILIFRPRS